MVDPTDSPAPLSYEELEAIKYDAIDVRNWNATQWSWFEQRLIATIYQERAARKAAEALLNDANGLLRSAFAIALREGEGTNWDAFGRKVEQALHQQHRHMYPHMHAYQAVKPT